MDLWERSGKNIGLHAPHLTHKDLRDNCGEWDRLMGSRVAPWCGWEDMVLIEKSKIEESLKKRRGRGSCRWGGEKKGNIIIHMYKHPHEYTSVVYEDVWWRDHSYFISYSLFCHFICLHEHNQKQLDLTHGDIHVVSCI